MTSHSTEEGGSDTRNEDRTTILLNTFGRIQSRVAQGTAPFIISSTTEVSNLNVNYLQGYTALGLPYLKRTTNE